LQPLQLKIIQNIIFKILLLNRKPPTRKSVLCAPISHEPMQSASEIAGPVASGSRSNVSRNTQSLVERPDHGEGQRSFAIQNLRNPAFRAQKRNKILPSQPFLIHGKLDGLQGRRRGDGVVLPFVGLDQRSPDLQLVKLGTSRFRTENRFDPGQGRFVIGVYGSS
jgi:hypothetical protein